MHALVFMKWLHFLDWVEETMHLGSAFYSAGLRYKATCINVNALVFRQLTFSTNQKYFGKSFWLL